MPNCNELADLINRIRAGDSVAAEDLVRRYEPAIRREARLRLGSSLQRECDSIDISQSVFGSFFLRLVAGQFEFETNGHVMGLLLAMARNKIREKARKRREYSLGGFEPCGRDPDPIHTILTRDFVDRFRRRLADDELALWERRRDDRSWTEIATELGGTPESIRQRYSRAIRRVANELGLEV